MIQEVSKTIQVNQSFTSYGFGGLGMLSGEQILTLLSIILVCLRIMVDLSTFIGVVIKWFKNKTNKE